MSLIFPVVDDLIVSLINYLTTKMLNNKMVFCHNKIILLRLNQINSSLLVENEHLVREFNPWHIHKKILKDYFSEYHFLNPTFSIRIFCILEKKI